MNNQFTNKQEDTEEDKIAKSKVANDFLNMIAAPGLIRKTPIAKDTEQVSPPKKETTIKTKKTIRKKKLPKQQTKTKDKLSKTAQEKRLMTVRVDAQIFQLVKFVFQPQTKISYKIINEILIAWLKQEHPEMLHLIPEEE